ncbi:MAG: hypothetical protein RL367_158 [Pseudomonadota bacterium]|jgi:predicted nucleic acid-binding protein
MRIAFDTNILAYMAGVDKIPEDRAKIEKALAMHARLAASHDCIAPLQALGELYVVLFRFRKDRVSAREIVEAYQEQFEPAPTSLDGFSGALKLATDHKLQLWDALILYAAAEVGCAMFLSEDLQPGFIWRGMCVVNPLADLIDRRLASALGQ